MLLILNFLFHLDFFSSHNFYHILAMTFNTENFIIDVNIVISDFARLLE